MASKQLARLLDVVGRDAFDRAADFAWATAPTTGLAGAPDGGDNSLLHELCWHVSQLGPPGKQPHRKQRLLCELYELAPDYVVLMALYWEHRSWSTASRRFLWRRYRRWLTDDEALAAPAQYSLWCDWFEDRQTVAAAWRAVVRRPWHPVRMERVLDCCGPVPFPLKARLYAALVSHRRWHRSIYTSLVHSARDVYGSLDPEGTRELLARLELPPETPDPTFFQDRFGWAVGPPQAPSGGRPRRRRRR